MRSKVSCIRARQDPQPDGIARARELAELALAHLERGRVRLVLVGGLPGAGKTTVAETLAARTGWAHLSSDVTRKRLAGIDADQHRRDSFRTGLYAPDMTALTYDTMLADARILQRTSTPSDATPAIGRTLGVGADPWPEASTIDTTVSIEGTQRSVAALVGRGPDVQSGREPAARPTLP